MTIPPRIARIGALGALVSTLIIGGTATVATAVTLSASQTVASSQVIAAVGDICYSDLPSQAHDTLDLIEQGGPYPFPQDGTVFQNREGILPSQSSGYYHEYTVITPGSDDRGAKRIVTGNKTDEDYYTSDHYASFDLVDYGC
ncbi:ribonuclease [Streptomyces sp. SID8361]|uniref:ribonuclease domain-containing protein n=1 Tax=Streptomyces sp. MnatMP-M27 TaxID=1839768 RepID=UPI00081F6C07|nr:ribonuclease [Streptomyces sp. MnatMP-M27]MYU11115.1 ribonuclease [Streptomyces sp. SID8361]SCF78430.1 ribonuclease T1 [Streptomyces sp. MnatMP-M27]